MLQGAQRILVAAGCAVVDVRPVAGAGTALGVALSGLIAPEVAVWTGGAREGDALILTKPLGGAMVLRAALEGRAKGRWRQAALASMVRGNAAAIPILRAHGASAGTDVMGAGLGTSAGTMLRGTALMAQFDPGALPLLPGVKDLLDGPFIGSDMLAMAEISGGVLAAVPAMLAESCRDELRRAGYPAAIIGSVGAADLPAARPFGGVSYSKPARAPELLAVP
jgi:selenide,water dikinase